MRFALHAACGLLLTGLVSGCGTDEATTDTADTRLIVRRDDMGVVHIDAPSDEAAYYGAGYMQAVDRLFQMDLMRRRALGRRAEVLGASVANDDELMRRVNIAALGAQNMADLRASYPNGAALVDAWTAGVNARIAEVLGGRAPLPYGFGSAELGYQPERWTSEDALAVGKLIVFGNANQIQYDLLATVLRQLAPRAYALPLLEPLRNTFIVGPPASAVARTTTAVTSSRLMPAPSTDAATSAELSAFVAQMAELEPGASNNWAITGTYTANGRPLLANDPHQPLKSPSLMWAHHMSSAARGGSLDVVGFGFVGTPSVQLGHNRTLAWAATTTYPDMMDVWDVEITGNQARIGGELRELALRTETIHIRAEADRVITVEEAPGFGILLPPAILPIPVAADGHRLLFNWTGFRPTHEALGFGSFDTAQSLDDFEAAVDTMEIAAFNFLAASASGISYRSSMLVPDRGPGSAERPRWALQDGSDPTSFWSGNFLSRDLLPKSHGEARGFLVTANNDPFGFTENGRFDDDPYYFGAFFDPGTRAYRIDSELQRAIVRGKLDVSAMQNLQADTYSIFADDVIPLLTNAFAARLTDPALAAYRDRADMAELVDRLSKWDRRMQRASSDAVVFNAYLFLAIKRAIADEFGLTFNAIIGENQPAMLRFGLLPLLGRVPDADSYLTPGKNLVLLQALDDTIAYLSQRFGGIEASRYTWGAVHGTQFDHVWPGGASVGFVPTDGGSGTVNVSDTNFFSTTPSDGKLKATSGPIFRSVTEFDESGTPIAYVNFPPGNAGEPTSPFFRDRLDDWLENRSRKLLFEPDEIAAHTVETLELTR